RLALLGGCLQRLRDVPAERLRVLARAVQAQVPVELLARRHVRQLVDGGREVTLRCEALDERGHILVDGVEAERAVTVRHAAGHQRGARWLTDGCRDVALLEAITAGGKGIE